MKKYKNDSDIHSSGSLSHIKSIGLMRTSALGDIIWTIPLIRCLQKHCPQAKLFLFVDKVFAPVVEDIENLEVIAIKKPRSLKDYFFLNRIFKPFKFDIFLCTQASLRINFLYPMIHANRKIGLDSKRGRDGHCFFVNERIPFHQEHSLEAFLGFARYLGIDDCEIRFDLPLLREDEEFAKKEISSEGMILIHPRASFEQRTWSADRYGDLINSLSKIYPQKIGLTGLSSDLPFIEKIISQCHLQPLNFAGRTNLKQLAALLKYADLLIAPDTGPIHLAQAHGTQTVGLYAAVSPEYTGPYQQSRNCVNAYPIAVEKFLRKDPGDVSWRTRVRADGIMDLISVDQVLEKVSSILK